MNATPTHKPSNMSGTFDTVCVVTNSVMLYKLVSTFSQNISTYFILFFNVAYSNSLLIIILLLIFYINVVLSVPNDANCRHGDLCSACPEPTYCLTQVKAAGT